MKLEGRTKKITVGNMSMSKEGWEWWINVFINSEYSFTRWLKVSEAITKINEQLKPSCVYANRVTKMETTNERPFTKAEIIAPKQKDALFCAIVDSLK